MADWSQIFYFIRTINSKHLRIKQSLSFEFKYLGQGNTDGINPNCNSLKYYLAIF